MRPEPGDPSVRVTVEDVAAGARSVGVQPGDTVMFHSSLSSMGHVVGGPNTVIEGFLRAVGPEGTVAVPTLWWNGTQDLADWDPETSPSYPGIITETFRQRPDSIRSNNPTHSISAIGRRAAELTADHGKWGLRPCIYRDEAFAEASPWERLYQWNAHYCFIGVDFTVNTMGHYCQSRLVEWALQQAPPERRAELDRRISRWEDIQEYYEQRRRGLTDPPRFTWPNYNFQRMGQHLESLGLVRLGKIGSATLRAIYARDMVDTILATLIAHPEEWLSEPFLSWWYDAVGRGEKRES
jgi:aminoglycoside 3-N-acetyltransferase